MALGQSSLARPGQLLQAPPPAGLVVGGLRRRGGRKVKSSWVKAEIYTKETRQDVSYILYYIIVEYSCLHCRRTLTGLNATRLKNHLLNPGACKFLCSTSVQEVAMQVAELMTVLPLGVCSMTGDSPGYCRASCRGGCSSAHRYGADGSGCRGGMNSGRETGRGSGEDWEWGI